MKKQIIIEIGTHKGQQVEIYVPQIDIGNGWKNVMEPGTYVLKETHDAFEICKKCSGAGCNECNNRGTKKVPATDNLPIAEMLLEKKAQKILEAQKILLNL